MREVRMMIEDYELMGHARRAFLAWAKRSGERGVELAAGERKAVRALEADTRLDSAVLMTWESSPEGDLGWVAALRWLREHVADDLASAHVPEAERPDYLAVRYEAIARTLAKLDGSLLEGAG